MQDVVVAFQQHELIANFLRKEITSGALHPGDPLPSEAELCEQFSSSRGPVRQAMSTLRNEGLISSGRGRRSVVLENIRSQPFDSVISFTQWCLESGVQPGQKTQWMIRKPADKPMADALEIAEGEPIVSLLRLRTMDGTPAMLERLTYPLWVGQHVLNFDPDSGSIYQRIIDCGVDIHHASRAIDAIAAPQEDAELLGVEPGAPLLRMYRRAFTREGVPIEASDDRYLPSRARFSLVSVRGNRSPLSLVTNQGDAASA
ncbi:GntR family transcriptional regulator [Corynebacterium pelargi]|uniref:GntR family transcriptional regulator n=1 Tax=Corynebacterium pelargi TaxID=1471400 RepID=UPI001008DD44|nr:GntR family transcriptional regulator [Corynebacterium pelargi]GGG74943.1 GntR family transcriptional regulator [Corynebacterium pelargi]